MDAVMPADAPRVLLCDAVTAELLRLVAELEGMAVVLAAKGG